MRSMVVHAGPGTAGAPRPGDRRRAADGCDARLDQPGQITREPAAEPGSAQPTQPGMVAASRWPAIQKRGQGQVHDASLCVAQLIRPHFAGRRALASSAQQWLPDHCGRHAERPGGRDGRVLTLHRVRAQGPAGRVSRHRLSVRGLRLRRVHPRQQLRPHLCAAERRGGADPKARIQGWIHTGESARCGQHVFGLRTAIMWPAVQGSRPGQALVRGARCPAAHLLDYPVLYRRVAFTNS